MSNSGVKRRLAAIMAADVVGFSRLMGEDEAGTLGRLKSLYRDIIQPKIYSADGRVVKLMGDGLLAEFPSVVEAVHCAVGIQESILSRDISLAEDQRIKLRIGINLGDIIVEGDDIYGDGVNIAARLEGLASPGCVSISEAVHSAIGNKMQISCRYIGEQTVKNISEPIKVYEITGQATGASEGPVLRTPDRPSIAVLPFDNMSGDPEQDYFSDGMTEDIITALSHFRSFPVIARNSTFTYKGRAVRVQQVGAELGARYVLEGSVRKAGDNVRITAQLVDAETGHHLWAGKFDSSIEDIFAVQDDITRKIVATIQPELAQAELDKAAVKRPENLTAWDLVLRGMALVNRHSADQHKPARVLFRSAIELDPDYAEAWTDLAWSYLVNITLISPDERQNFLEKGLKAAQQAVKLDERSAFAHYVLGVAYVWGEQIQKSISEAEISLQLNPYSAQTHMGLGNRLDLVGRTAEGISKMEQGLKLSPLDPFCPVIMAYLSRAHLTQDQPDTALEWIEKAVNLRSDNPDLHYRHAICLAYLDRAEEAKQALAECERLQSGFLESRKDWRPYAEDKRNLRYFAGMRRHGL